MRYLIVLCVTAFSLLMPVQQSFAFVLADTDDTLQIVTASAVSTITMQATWFDSTTSANSPSVSEAAVTTATTTTLVSSPAASTQRIVKNLTIYNSHASSSNLITVQRYNGTTAYVQYKYTLLPGESLQWTLNDGFSVLDSLGNKRTLTVLKTPNGDSVIDEANDAVKTTAATVSPVSGNIAHDSAESQYPVVTGCHATASLAGETLVTAGDAARCYSGRDGAIINRPDASLEDVTYAVVTATTGANTSLVAAAGAGIKTCIKYIIVNAIGTTSANYAILTDGSGGTTKADLVYPSGLSSPYRFPLPLCSTANTAWYVDSQGTETLRVTVGYFKSQE